MLTHSSMEKIEGWGIRSAVTKLRVGQPPTRLPAVRFLLPGPQKLGTGGTLCLTICSMRPGPPTPDTMPIFENNVKGRS